MIGLYSLALLMSAALLFLLEPMVGKFVLPLLGSARSCGPRRDGRLELANELGVRCRPPVTKRPGDLRVAARGLDCRGLATSPGYPVGTGECRTAPVPGPC